MQEQEQVLLQEQEMEDPDSPVDNRSTGEPVHAEEPVGAEEHFGQIGIFGPNVRHKIREKIC